MNYNDFRYIRFNMVQNRKTVKFNDALGVYTHLHPVLLNFNDEPVLTEYSETYYIHYLTIEYC